MGEEGSSSGHEEEVCLSEKSWGNFLNLDGDDIHCSGDSPISDKIQITPASSTVETPTPTNAAAAAAATETTTKEPPPPPPAAKPSSSSTKKRGCRGDDNVHIMTERERRKRMRDMFANLHALLPQLPLKADKSSIVDEAVRYIKKLQCDLKSLQKRKQERLQFQATAAAAASTATSLIPSTGYINSREAAAAALFFGNDQAGSSSSSSNIIIPSANSSLNSSPVRFPVAFQIWTSSNVVLTLCGLEAQFNICSPKKFGVLSAIFFVLDKYDIDVMAANISSLNDYSINYMIQAQARGGQDQSLELFSLEDIYKQAALEIMEWTSS